MKEKETVVPFPVQMSKQQAYQQACYQAGDMQYRIFVMKRDLRKLNENLIQLAVEAQKEIEIQAAVKRSVEEESLKKMQNPKEEKYEDNIQK